MALLFGSIPPIRKNGMSAVITKPIRYGLTDFTPGMAWIWLTMRSSRVLRLRSATFPCISVMLPVPPLPASVLSWPMTPLLMPPSITSVATPMPMPVAERMRARAPAPQVAERLAADISRERPLGHRRRPPPS